MVDLGDCREQQHLRELEGEMTSRGWVRDVDFLGEVSYFHGKWHVDISPLGEWVLILDKHGAQDNGDSLQGLREALSSTGIEAPR